MAQTEDVVIAGKVVDKITKQPIPVVRISSSVERVSTNEQGEFKIKAKEGDQLTFIHLSYQAITQVISSKSEKYQLIEMEERILEMVEFEVTNIPSEEAFKEAMMNASPSHIYERSSMQRNLINMMRIKDLAYKHDFSSYNTLLKNINTDGGVTFFSTNPSVGLVGALKKLIGNKANHQFLGDEPLGTQETRPLWRNPLKVEPLKLE